MQVAERKGANGGPAAGTKRLPGWSKEKGEAE